MVSENIPPSLLWARRRLPTSATQHDLRAHPRALHPCPSRKLVWTLLRVARVARLHFGSTHLL